VPLLPFGPAPFNSRITYVTAFGAKGDGVTDDYAAVAAAISSVQSAGGGWLFFPKGTYVCSQTPTITGSNMLITGEGVSSVILLATAAQASGGNTIGLWLNGAKNITIKDLVLDGNFSSVNGFNTAYSGGFALPSSVTGVTYSSGGATHPAQGTQETWTVGGISAGSQVGAGYFNGCVFQVGTGHTLGGGSNAELCKLVSGVGTTSWVVIRGYGQGFQSQTAAISGGTALQGIVNTMYDAIVATYGTKSNKNYILALGISGSVDGTTYLTQGMPLRISASANILVEGCHIRYSRTAGAMVDGTWTGGFGLNQTGSPSTDIMFRNNRIYNTVDNGIFFYQVATGCSAIGNTISDVGYNGVAAVTSTRVTVVANQIRNCGPQASGDPNGIELAGCYRGVVSENQIENCTLSGVVLLCSQQTPSGFAQAQFVPCVNTIVVGNVISSSNNPPYLFDNSLAQATGVDIAGADSCAVLQNRIISCDQGINVENQARDTQIKANLVEFCYANGIVTAGSDNVQGTVVDGNTVRGCGSNGCIENAPAVWKNNIIIDNGGLPGYAPQTGPQGTGLSGDGILVQAAPSGRAKKETWVVNNQFGDNRNNAIEVSSGFQSAGLLHFHDNEFYNSESQQYFDACIAQDGSGVCTIVSASAHLVSGDVSGSLKIAVDAFTGPITATLTTFESTTVAAGSNGGNPALIASWSSPSAGNLAVASTTGFAGSGFIQVALSGGGVAILQYTGTSGGNSFTGCTYISGTPGTVATGGAVTQTVLGSLSTSQPNSFAMANVGMSLLASRLYTSRGLFMDSSSSGPFELWNNKIRSLQNATPNGNIPTNSTFYCNKETNNSNATPDHLSGTGTLSAATTTAVSFASSLPIAPTEQQISVIFKGNTGQAESWITSPSTSGFTINFPGSASAVGYSYSVDLGR
jgi:hypothetical protein